MHLLELAVISVIQYNFNYVRTMIRLLGREILVVDNDYTYFPDSCAYTVR